MKCPRCQAENGAGARFCEDCGARLETACPNCGTPVTPGKKFCRSCGAALTTEPAGRFGNPESYTPKHLAEKILTSRAALEGERKQVTVLFADLKGSMELLADRDPEEARKILDPVLERMMEAVHRYEGTVNQVMGDGVMALFGAPLAHEDHAVRACYAALRMQETVNRYAEEMRRTQGTTVRIRIGLNSGDVVVRAVGSDLRMDYTAVGQTTHLAARMEQLADPGAILLSSHTLGLVEGQIQVKALGPMPVKGLAEPVAVYEMVGVSTVRSRFQAAAARGLTAFVGRSTEMEQLYQALDHAKAGRGQVVAVVGEPGVGKSRLYHEFTHSHRVQDCFVIASTSVSYGKAASYFPLIDLLRTYFRIESRDDARLIREKVMGRLLSLDRALEPFLPAMLWLLDVSTDDPHWERLDPPQRRQQILDGVKRLLLRESHTQPVVVVFEDLHWIDAETQALVDALVEGLPAARLLMLVNYRPEYQHTWGSKTYYRQLRVDPLPVASAHQLLDSLLGNDPTVRPLKALLVHRTEGTPFFLEESVRTLVETKVLLGDRGAYRLLKSVDAIEVPATVKALLAARIDRLNADEKAVLQAASVIGTDVPFQVLQAIADISPDQLRRCLAQLQAAEFLYEIKIFPDLEYTFKHALTHEVAYQGLLHDRRRALHARITEAIERLTPERLAEQAERLAYHALRGESWEKAVHYLHQSGDRAIRRSACREAIVHLEQALASLGHLPENRETTELNIDIRLALRNALLPLSEWERMGEHLHEAEALARTLGDQRRLGYIAAFRVVQCRLCGDYDESVRFGREALSIARTLGDRSLEALAAYFLGITHATRGEFSDAVTFLDRSIELESDLASRPYLADALSQLGRFDEAIGHAETAVQIAEAADHPHTLSQGLLNLGRVYLRRGDLPRATQVLKRCSDLCRTSPLGTTPAFVAATLGVVYALADRAHEALPLVAGAFEEFRRRPQTRPPALILLCAGMIHLAAGQVDEAAGYARETLALTRRTGARPIEAEALCLAGDVASAGGAEDAEGLYREALALADQLGIRPVVAHGHLGLGKLYKRMGQREKATEHLSTATTMYREMGMTYWLEKAEGELGVG